MFEIAFSAINYWGIIVAAVASVVVGSIWYGPLFGKFWMKELNIQKPDHMGAAEKNAMMRSYAITTVGSLVLAFVVNHLVNVTGVGAEGWCAFAFLLWLGFIVPTTALNTVLWEGKSWKLYGVNVLYYLVMLEIDTAIFVFWPF